MGHYEHDCAIVPRIFLHCARMEFTEVDGTPFIASCELAPDLQGALRLIERLSRQKDDTKSGSLPGLVRLLEDTADNEVEFPPAEEGAAEAFVPRKLSHIGVNSRCPEQAECKKIQRGNETAMLWTLTMAPEYPELEEKGETKSKVEDFTGATANLEDSDTTATIPAETNDKKTHVNQSLCTTTGAADSDYVLVESKNEDACTSCKDVRNDAESAASTLAWGPGILWVPTVLVLQQREFEFGLDTAGDAVDPEHLGGEWGKFGADWCWAHNGLQPNGWFRLCVDGQLVSKWGSGSWELLKRADGLAPLLLVTFNAVEHALRLMQGDVTPGRFDVVAIRRIKDGQRSLKTDDFGASRALQEDAPAICGSQGWPNPDAVSNPEKKSMEK